MSQRPLWLALSTVNTTSIVSEIRMEAFAEQLKVSARQAAMVAQALATTGLDEMAAEDAYVQSEGYNHHASRSVSRPPPTIADATRSTMTASSSSSVASDRRTALRRRPEDQSYLFSSSSDEDDTEENDPIWSLLRQEQSTTDPSEPKDVHRFLDDLDRRLARPVEPDPSHDRRSTMAPPAEGTGGLSAWRAILGVPSAPVLARAPTTVPPLARPKPRPTPDAETPVVVEMVSSTALFGAADRQQWEQLRSLERPATSGPLRRLYERLCVQEEHRREMFIVLTLVLCAYVYFHATRV
jgi:hypothetical protein